MYDLHHRNKVPVRGKKKKLDTLHLPLTCHITGQLRFFNLEVPELHHMVDERLPSETKNEK
jgi:hypothetical protein